MKLNTVRYIIFSWTQKTFKKTWKKSNLNTWKLDGTKLMRLIFYNFNFNLSYYCLLAKRTFFKYVSTVAPYNLYSVGVLCLIFKCSRTFVYFSNINMSIICYFFLSVLSCGITNSNNFSLRFESFSW